MPGVRQCLHKRLQPNELTSRRSTGYEHFFRIDLVFLDRIRDHVRDGIRVAAAIVRKRRFARHVPAFGCRARPYSHVTFAVRALLPRNLVVLEVFLRRGLAGVNGDNESVALDLVGHIHPPAGVVSMNLSIRAGMMRTFQASHVRYRRSLIPELIAPRTTSIRAPAGRQELGDAFWRRVEFQGVGSPTPRNSRLSIYALFFLHIGSVGSFSFHKPALIGSPLSSRTLCWMTKCMGASKHRQHRPAKAQGCRNQASYQAFPHINRIQPTHASPRLP